MLALERRLELAKPGIPIEKPQRRQNPEIVNPVPQRLPSPEQPVKVPQEPVPVTR